MKMGQGHNQCLNEAIQMASKLGSILSTSLVYNVYK